MIHEAVRDARTRHGLSLPELADRIRLLAETDKSIETVDRTSLSRIENGVTLRPRDSTLRAIALALGEAPSYFIARTQREWTLSIGATHGIFSAPVIIAALTQVIEGARFTTFGQGRSDDPFTAVWSNLSANGKRSLLRPPPPVKVPDAVRDDAVAGLKLWRPGDPVGSDGPNGAGGEAPLRIATASKIMELWNRNEIDVAVVSADVFKLQNSSADEAVHCATLTHNSGRGVSLVVLSDPARVPNPPAAMDIIPHVAARDFAGGQIIVPANTFATAHVKELERIASDSISPREIRMGDYAEFRDKVFDALDEPQNNGVVIVALWEPFVVFLRQDWRERMKSAGQTASDEEDPPGWGTCSLNRTIDNMGSVGLPTVTMDLMVRKKYLDEASGVPVELEQFLSRIQGISAELNQQSGEFRKLATILKELAGGLSAKRFAGKVSHEIQTLALYYGISELDCIRAVAAIGFEFSYSAEYVEYLKKQIVRRPSASRDGPRARTGE